ncbi:MAG TPA: hypothetical protein VGX68_06330, partial [Thermoanaerobaculia bacterium]|nr:hypothetical protein [Thermoanaerobaculia bacterium]
MTTHPEELRSVAQELHTCSRRLDEPDLTQPIAALEEVITEVGKAWSRSWFGYHANVYYNDLRVPPPGAHFSSEWGMNRTFSMGTRGEWVEYDVDKVKQEILRRAGQPDLESARRVATEAGERFEDAKARLTSVLEIEKTERDDAFISKLLEDATNAILIKPAQVIQHWRPSGTLMSRDSLAMSQGLWTPPHLSLYADLIALKSTKAACDQLAGVAVKAASHLERVERRRTRD